MEINEVCQELDKIERKQWMFRKTGDLAYLKKANCLIEELLNKVGDQERDELDVCDLCGKQFWFSEGVIYYINDEPMLLCPECVEAQEDTVNSPAIKKGIRRKANKPSDKGWKDQGCCGGVHYI